MNIEKKSLGKSVYVPDKSHIFQHHHTDPKKVGFFKHFWPIRRVQGSEVLKAGLSKIQFLAKGVQLAHFS